jgi:enoyl-CoA hydratase
MNTLRYELSGDGLLTLTIDRPKKLNALSAEVLDDLSDAFRRAEDDADVRGVLLTGAGEKAFVAGADISQFPDLTATEGQRFARRGQSVFDRIEQLSKPVIAAVNGYALGGGCELALACHLRTASHNARFGQPEAGLGIIPGYGGTQRLPRVVGRGLATELILTGEQISAERAYEIGLVNRLADDAVEAGRELLATITQNAPEALRLSLAALRASDEPLDAGLRYEAALFGQAVSTEDAAEGATAFLEKRAPAFEGQ